METSELRTYQSRLFELRTRLLREVGTVEEALLEDVMTAGDTSAVPSHPADQDVEGFDEQVILAQNEEQLLEDVEAALERIEAGAYGNCELCGQKIPKERLDALPQAATCVECARGDER
ncbi:MAG: TraR/DksA C4-type zinc finger protein [Pirellulales bacterium]